MRMGPSQGLSEPSPPPPSATPHNSQNLFRKIRILKHNPHCPSAPEFCGSMMQQCCYLLHFAKSGHFLDTFLG